MTKEKDQTETTVGPAAHERDQRSTIRLTDMVSETTSRLNGILAAVIGLRECPTDPMFGGVIQLIEDLLVHARHTEEIANDRSWFVDEERE